MTNLNMLVTQGDTLCFLSELGRVAVAREPSGREGMGFRWLGNETGWMERNGMLEIMLTYRVLVSG